MKKSWPSNGGEELEHGITLVLQRLSSLKLSRPGGMREIMLTCGEVDALLNTSYRLRELAPSVGKSGQGSDVAIDIVRGTDGSVVVLPAAAVT